MIKDYDCALLRTLRDAKKLTQAAVAAEINCSRQTVYRAEKGISAGHNLLKQLAEFYAIPLSRLFEQPKKKAAVNKKC